MEVNCDKVGSRFCHLPTFNELPVRTCTLSGVHVDISNYIVLDCTALQCTVLHCKNNSPVTGVDSVNTVYNKCTNAPLLQAFPSVLIFPQICFQCLIAPL